jgi:putative Holliday junction resolvase
MTAKDRILGHPSALIERLSPGARLLGIDLGAKTIGLAISDPAFRIASPITTLKRTKLGADAVSLAAIVAERGIGGLVIGLPLNMDGTEGPRAQATRDWSLDLAGRLDLPLVLWDERMSTMAVERMMLAADMTRKRRAEKVDQAAAAYILQGAIDAIA